MWKYYLLNLKQVEKIIGFEVQKTRTTAEGRRMKNAFNNHKNKETKNWQS